MDEQVEGKPLARQSPPLAGRGLPRKQRRRRGGLVAILIVLIAAATIGMVLWNSSRTPSVHYLTTPAMRGNITRIANATGTVNPVLTIIVGAYVSGTIRQVFCDYNTLVKAGQICAKIDPRPYKATLDQYLGQLACDQGILAQAQMDLARYQKLAEQNSIARQQAEDQFYVVQQDIGTVKLDEALVEGARVNLAYTDIISPVEGIVVSRAVTQGQTVASAFQTPTLFLIATDLTNMQVDTNTSEGDIGGVKIGDAVTFTVDSYPRRIFQGTIVQVRESPQTVQNVVTYDAVVGVFLQPLLRQRILEAVRRRRISQIERARGSRVILLVHREERVSLLGLPIVRYLDMNDSEEVMRAIQLTDPNMPLDVVLHTPGGLYLAATQIARALTGHKGKVTVFVPHYAMSGGTLIALAANEIVMCRHSVLGPLDRQVDGLPAVSLLRVIEQKPIAEIDDGTLVFADIAQKMLAQIEQTVAQLLADRMEATVAMQLATTLTSGRWTHDYAITADEARDLGLPVKTEMPKEVLDLLALYPQPILEMPCVEYLPSPHSRVK